MLFFDNFYDFFWEVYKVVEISLNAKQTFVDVVIAHKVLLVSRHFAHAFLYLKRHTCEFFIFNHTFV